mmetsp:Transcript_5489/g.9571  ORF Transcript_5489/g.9571 Transcript_5489/m.9571 type:complete len:565 (-) Transcript_5489:41-1735(-)|eukprot:CAMPEP_0197440746 /NCGR_PEP_ID=MMETSP1175-20131217/7170_1 /TAXON_ID=1003142 /ORGANISM="Triceratium dubium, Strain CCMP147" /LENGTH=564 /DNA_ID=CAMNT_0042970905 /DNA_START=108 /DNA_END=1802 /DNA_ORIENTATION=-
MARSSAVLLLALAATLGVAMAVDTVTLSSFPADAAANLGWREFGVAPADTIRTVRFALTRSNDAALTRIASQVSDPAHPLFTQYLSMSDVATMMAAENEAVAAVSLFLASAGVEFEVEQPSAHVITAKMTVGQASALFNTEFKVYMNLKTAQTAVVGAEVTLPSELAAHVEAVFGIHGLPLPPRVAAKPASPAFASVDPKVIETAYKVSGVTPTGSDKNRQAVVEFQGQLLSQSDLTQFFKQFVPNAKSGDDKVYKYVGDNQSGEGVEANLDIQYIMGVAPGIKTEAWQYAGQDFCSDLKQWTTQLIGTTNPPNVFSVSYGWQGDMSQIGCSTSQIASIDADFKTISAAGVTIIFASGDSGSGYTSFFGSDVKLYSSWPASSDWVTAVGATGFINQDPTQGESATTQFGSGGGFSRIVTPAPEWQSSAISTFYKEETKAPPQSEYGYGGRGTPDVAALGEGFQVVIGGGVEPVGGTSAAAPTFAALTSLVNEARVQAGKKPLGNLNKWIYSNTDMFTDVTVGNNRISRQGVTVPDGFDCVKGWDPVTGWGTVDFPKFLKAAMSA